MNYGQILKADTANGLGIRLVFFVSGCTNNCKNCFQPQTHDFNYGLPYTIETENQIIKELSKPYYDGITIMGGEPLELKNQETVMQLILRIREELPDKNIWLFTGSIYDENLLPGQSRHMGDITETILNNVDVLVDGPFIPEKQNLCIDYRGSENQRLIDLKETRRQNKIVLLTDNTTLNLK